MKVYKAKKSGFINYIILGFSLLPVFVFYLEKASLMEHPLVFFILLLPLTFILYIYYNTSYSIKTDKLFYQSGVMIKGSIEISSIRQIIKGKTLWTGTRPALATGGLIIKFKRYEEIYIAPENNEELIADLCTINPSIEVINK